MAVHKRGGDDCEVAGRTVVEVKSEEWRTKSEESNGLSEEWKVKSEESNGLSEERRVKSEKSNGFSEDTGRNECWANPTSCFLFAQSSLHPPLLFSCSLVLTKNIVNWGYASNECWAKPNQTSCSRFAQSSLHPSLLFSCSLVLIFRSEKWKVKSEKSNGLSEDTQATSVEQSPTKPHVLFLLNQAFTLPHVLLS